MMEPSDCLQETIDLLEMEIVSLTRTIANQAETIKNLESDIEEYADAQPPI